MILEVARRWLRGDRVSSIRIIPCILHQNDNPAHLLFTYQPFELASSEESTHD